MRIKPTSSFDSTERTIEELGKGRVLSRSQKVHSVSISHIGATNTKFALDANRRSFVAEDSRRLRKEDQIALANLTMLVKSYGKELFRPRSRTHKYDVLKNDAVC